MFSSHMNNSEYSAQKIIDILLRNPSISFKYKVFCWKVVVFSSKFKIISWDQFGTKREFPGIVVPPVRF